MNVPDRDSWDIDTLVSELEAIYMKSPARRAAWPEEKPGIVQAVTFLDERVLRYRSATALGVGGLGIVLKVEDRALKDQACAIKFPRPKSGSQELFAEMISKEIERLSEVRHSGVVRIHTAGTARLGNDQRLPFYVMDYIDGSDSSNYMSELHGKPLVEVIRRSSDAIAALHDADLVHCDIKPDNIMIDARGRPVITDLGTTKAFRPDDDSETRIGVTLSFAPRDLTSYIIATSDSDPDNFSGSIARSRIRKQWDLVCFGKTILSWLGYALATGEPSTLTFAVSQYTRKYLLLMAARMLGATDGYPWLYEQINLPESAIKELQYVTIAEVVADIEKISGRRDLTREVPELDPYEPHRVQIGPQGAAVVTPRVQALLDHPVVKRLGAITQLGIVSQVYPTATHSRLEHSLGTYSNTCMLVRSLYHDPYSPLFRQIMTAEDLAGIIALSLLHDTGQFPLAHDLEEIDADLFDHKRLTRAVFQGERNPKKAGFQRFDLPSIDAELDEWDLNAEGLVRLLDVRLDRYKASVKERILHSIIDGAIDADKLDYLVRDSSRLGIPYGRSVDIERISGGVTSIVTVNRAGNSVACIGVHEKARVAAESLAKARSEMYSQVYWHHTVRSMKAMVGRAVQRLAVHLESSDATKNQFVSEFENFVMSLPGTLAPGAPQLALDDGQESKRPATPLRIAAEEPGGLAATDVAVLAFLERYMAAADVKDSELLHAVRVRSLYKRLHVWSLGDDEEGAREMAEGWDALRTAQKLAVYERLELEIGRRVGAAAETNPETVALASDSVRKVQARAESRHPILLIDLPDSKPESEIPLYFVREAERRVLRRDGSSVGKAYASRTWEQYGGQLREHAGKLRVYCDAIAIDAVEATMDRGEFVQMFDEARASVVAIG